MRADRFQVCVDKMTGLAPALCVQIWGRLRYGALRRAVFISTFLRNVFIHDTNRYSNCTADVCRGYIQRCIETLHRRLKYSQPAGVATHRPAGCILGAGVAGVVFLYTHIRYIFAYLTIR